MSEDCKDTAKRNRNVRLIGKGRCMRIIHCADLHLDSRMTAGLSSEQAKERRRELLLAFRTILDRAEELQAEAVIIAGDLFDRQSCSVSTRNACIALMQEHPDIRIFYLQGNHDSGDVFERAGAKLPNLHRFSADSWISYTLSDPSVRITGAEFTEENYFRLPEELSLKKEDYNLVVLHGQAEDSRIRRSGYRQGSAYVIPLRSLKDREIDYLALGHIHSRAAGRLDGRGIWCYPGCPEGRGFDECGEKGCVLLDIDPVTHSTKLSFIPIAGRIFHEISVDVTGLANGQEILRAVRKKLEEAGCIGRDLVKVILTGFTEIGEEIPMEYLTGFLESEFYFAKTENQTRLRVKEGDFVSDPSLKGEFVRRVRRAEDLTEEEKEAVIRLGIRLLIGEEDAYEDS